MNHESMTGYASIDRPWLKYYTAEQINAELPKCKIYDYIWYQNRQQLTNIALHYYGRNITYGQMFEGIEKAAKSFRAIGVKKGDIVAVIAVTLPETIYTFYGLNRIGAIANMIDPRTSVEGIKNYIEEVNAEVIVLLDAVYEKVNAAVQDTTIERMVILSPADALPFVKKQLYRLTKRVQIQEDEKCKTWKTFIQEGINQEIEDTPYQENECCVIVHTGGTTGNPKGVMLSNDNLNQSAFQGINCSIDMQRKHNWLNIMPPFIAYGIGVGLHLTLIIGMKVILIPAFKPEEFAELLVKYRPIHMVGVPSHYENIINSRLLRDVDLSFIIAPTVGGDGMPADLEEAVNRFLAEHGCTYKVVKGYGLTEISAEASVCVSNECNKIGSVGVPCSHTIVSVFDPETGEELTYGQRGEICISGPNTMLGYYKNEEETNHILQLHQDKRIWVHSGDLGYMDEDGMLFIEGRLKRMIVRHDGFKVFPSLIENTIQTCPDVQACCVVGADDQSHSQGKLPVAYVVLETNTSLTAKQVKDKILALCQKDLPEYAQPTAIHVIEKLPLTAIGKVDYRALELRAASET